MVTSLVDGSLHRTICHTWRLPGEDPLWSFAPGLTSALERDRRPSADPLCRSRISRTCVVDRCGAARPVRGLYGRSPSRGAPDKEAGQATPRAFASAWCDVRGGTRPTRMHPSCGLLRVTVRGMAQEGRRSEIASGPPELVAFCRDQYAGLVGMLGLYCGDRAVAEELAQEALARVWRHWTKVERLDDPVAWAHRVAINLANSYFRRRAAERRARDKLEARSRPPQSQADPIDAYAVRTAIALLPRRQRTALVLHYYLDLPLVEVAERMDIPQGTAKSLVRRAVERLRREIAVYDSEEASHVP